MIEDRVRESLRDRADRVETSSYAWDGIDRTLRRRGRRARLQRAGLAAAILTVFAAGLTWTWLGLPDLRSVRPTETAATPVPVDPRVVDVIEVGRWPAGIAAGGGSAWVSLSGAGECDGEIVRLAVRGEETVETARIAVDGWPGDLAITGDAVWAEGSVCTDEGNAQAGVLRIDPATNRVVGFIPTGGGGFLSDVAVGEGAVWVTRTEEESAGEVLRIDSETGSIESRIPIAGDPRDVVVAEGSVWVLMISPGPETPSWLEILRIDPATDVVADRIPDVLGLGVGEDSLWLPVWLTQNDLGLKILDARTLEVREVVEGEFVGFSGDHGTLGSFPVGEGGAWVLHRPTAEDPADLVRVPPSGGGPDATVSPSGTDWGIDAALDPTTDTLWLARYEDAVVRVDLR
jgi:hypothetical protein